MADSAAILPRRSTRPVNHARAAGLGTIKKMKSNLAKYLAVSIAAAVLLSACLPAPALQTPTPTPPPTHTPQPSPTIDWFPDTPTPTPRVYVSTPDPLAGLTPPAYTQVIYEEDFTTDKQWELGSGALGNVTYVKGALSLALSGKKGEISSLSKVKLPDTFYLELTLESALCGKNDSFGIIFWRLSELGTYRMLYRCDGQARLERAIFDGVSIVQNWTPLRRYQPNAPAQNRLGIWADKGTLYFFVNDAFQFSAEGRKGLSGALGVFASASGEGAVTYNITGLRLTQP